MLDKLSFLRYTNEADFVHETNSTIQYGGITQLVEYSVHTRFVICSSQIAATRPVGQAVKTPPFHGGNMGSIPVRVTMTRKYEHKHIVRNVFAFTERIPPE